MGGFFFADGVHTYIARGTQTPRRQINGYTRRFVDGDFGMYMSVLPFSPQL